MKKTAAAAVLVTLSALPGLAGPGATAKLDPAATAISAKSYMAEVKRLASDEFEGRSPSSKGEALATNYLADQLKEAGAGPGNPDGTYFQKVPLLTYKTDPQASLAFSVGGSPLTLKFLDDFVAHTRRLIEHVDMTGDVVFVGYGVQAPEYNWDDTKGMDLRGKVLVMLVNDPPTADTTLFGGKAMTYYGRWTYKYEQAARLGAAGVFIVHETGPAGYPWEVVRNSWGGESFTMIGPDNNESTCPVEGWITQRAAEDLFARAGTTFAAAKQSAASRDFKPIVLGGQARLSFDNSLRRVESRNVIARIDGTDPKLKKEYVVYCAHWDHLGIDPSLSGDKIYNGAIDNATGTAGLIEIARAYATLAKSGRGSKRSILIFSPTAEERGLLGSEYYCSNPLYPLDKTVAVINMDGLNMSGRTKDFTIIGLGKSTLDDVVVEALKMQGRTVSGDSEPEKGYYYRSDHFNFAKVGVPSLHTGEGTIFVGKPADFGQKERERYVRDDYHKPSDEVKPDWDPSGAIEDLQMLFEAGLLVANAAGIPTWREGDEFKARRDKMMKP
jgi:Zn-dependent M28 family amino/carboxypeptidase